MAGELKELDIDYGIGLAGVVVEGDGEGLDGG